LTVWYSHFDARHLADVMDAQRVISGVKQSGKSTKAAHANPEGSAGGTMETGKNPGRAELNLVKLPEKKTALTLKRA
jgi:hypothetical protein